MARGRIYDREIVALALPALGALAAEPLYLLADTAIVGHLGTPQLAALALAATALGALTTIFNFLVYGTTARVAAAGPGRRALRIEPGAARVRRMAGAGGGRGGHGDGGDRGHPAMMSQRVFRTSPTPSRERCCDLDGR